MIVAILSPIWPGAIDELRRRYDCRLAFHADAEQKRQLLAEAEVVVVRSGVRLMRSDLEAAPHLRLVVRAGVGLDGIDTAALEQRGIALELAPLSAGSVAEHALSLMLALSHRIVLADRQLRQGRWEKHAGLGRDLGGKTLGLIGFGRIGQRLAELVGPFHMPILACDRSPDRPDKQLAATRSGVRFTSLEEVLSRADVVSIQAPLNEQTRRLLDADRLARMKPTALLINVGRGGIIDETALQAALSAGRLGGAALDVFEREPPGDSPLLQLDNFIGTPHAAAQTQEAQAHVGALVVQLIDTFARQRS